MTEDSDWKELGWIEVDAGGVAFTQEGYLLGQRHHIGKRLVESGAAYQATMVDCPLPVEVRRSVDGQVIAARMCFTDDVDDIDGRWKVLGELDLPDGRCVACDPDCEGSQYRLAFRMKPGAYVARVFEVSTVDDSDTLGLSISWVEPISVKESKG